MQQVKLSELIHAEYNPRKLTEVQYRHLKDSLSRFGCVDPIIVNKHPERLNIIVGGHQRARVWQDMGNDEIPAVFVELDRDRERELNVRLNKNSGSWDWDILANEFDIEELTDWGWSEEELTGLDFGEEETPSEPKEPKEPDTKTCPKCGHVFEDK